MRRIAALAMAVIMIVLCGTAAAESGRERSDVLKTIDNYTQNILSMYVTIYNVKPELITDVDIIMMYSYFKLMKSAKSAYLNELLFEFGANEALIQSKKQSELLDYEIDKGFASVYNLWLEGDITSDEVTESLINLIKVYTEAGKE